MPPPTKAEVDEAIRVVLLADKQGLLGHAERVRIYQLVHGKTPQAQLAYATKTLQLAKDKVIRISDEHRTNLEAIVRTAEEQNNSDHERLSEN